MANPLGTVAMLTHSYALVYYKKFDKMMRSGSIDNILSTIT